ncbi:MAG: MerR family transcriptional regulator [Bifidobacteriaceae bacterium]|nr:MerR family transcriptional regulator [Bifidobacteriaceae bacterium]
MKKNISESIGYKAKSVCDITNVTYRQLDTWTTSGLINASVCLGEGSGKHRLYSFSDILLVKLIKEFSNLGISTQKIRSVIESLRKRGVDDLSSISLFSDGVSVYECKNNEEIVDLLKGGQGVFGIAVGKIQENLEQDVVRFPSVHIGITDDIESNDVTKEEKSERKANRI